MTVLRWGPVTDVVVSGATLVTVSGDPAAYTTHSAAVYEAAGYGLAVDQIWFSKLASAGQSVLASGGIYPTGQPTSGVSLLYGYLYVKPSTTGTQASGTVYLTKLDSSGNILAQVAYGGFQVTAAQSSGTIIGVSFPTLSSNPFGGPMPVLYQDTLYDSGSVWGTKWVLDSLTSGTGVLVDGLFWFVFKGQIPQTNLEVTGQMATPTDVVVVAERALETTPLHPTDTVVVAEVMAWVIEYAFVTETVGRSSLVQMARRTGINSPPRPTPGSMRQV